MDPKMIRKPVKRGDCEPGGKSYFRPCPFTECRYHLGTRGTETCTLDMAEEEHTIPEIAKAMGEHEEAIKSVYRRAMEKFRVHWGNR
jgi:hypothetical protein